MAAVVELDSTIFSGPQSSLDNVVPSSTIHTYVQNVNKLDSHGSGTVYSDGIVTTDGFAYGVIAGVPNEPITDLTIGLTTAWWTSTQGHNRRTVEHFMRLGIPTVLVGAESSFRPDKKHKPSEVDPAEHKISLTRSAHNTHLAFDAVSENGLQRSIDTQDMILLGESRGAMVGKGILWLADNHDRNVVYADLTAPCFPEKFELHTIKDLLKQAYGERAAIATLASTLTLGRLVHYPATLDLHPQAVCANLSTFWPLFNGESGRLGHNVPPLQNLHVTTFNDDLVSMPDIWREIYANHPNVRIKQIDGAHLTIVHPKTMEHIERRLFGLLREIDIKKTTDPLKLDFNKVHLQDGDAPLTI